MGPTPPDPTLTLPLLAAAMALFAVAAVLLKVGRWPRRQGDTPHCRRCGYTLLGIDSPRCPECGSTLAAKGAIVHGECRRRTGATVAGAVPAATALLLLGALANGPLRHVDWYRYRPTSWVIDDLSTGPPPQARRAWDELRPRTDAGRLSVHDHAALDGVSLSGLIASTSTGRPGPLENEFFDRLVGRCAGGKLSAGHRDRFSRLVVSWFRSGDPNRHLQITRSIPTLSNPGVLEPSHHATLIREALERQAPGQPARAERLSVHGWYMQYLGHSEMQGNLSAEQRRRFFDQALVVALRVRPRIAAGHELPYQLEFDGNGPFGWSVEAAIMGIRLDGKTIRGPGNAIGTGLHHDTYADRVRIDPPGRHTFEIILRFGAYDGVSRGPSGPVPREERIVTLSAPFEAVADPAAAHGRLIDVPSLGTSLRAATVLGRMGRGQGPGELDLMVEITNPPVSVAFEVMSRVGGTDYPLGDVAVAKGGSVLAHVCGRRPAAGDPSIAAEGRHHAAEQPGRRPTDGRADRHLERGTRIRRRPVRNPRVLMDPVPGQRGSRVGGGRRAESVLQ